MATGNGAAVDSGVRSVTDRGDARAAEPTCADFSVLAAAVWLVPVSDAVGVAIDKPPTSAIPKQTDASDARGNPIGGNPSSSRTSELGGGSTGSCSNKPAAVNSTVSKAQNGISHRYAKSDIRSWLRSKDAAKGVGPAALTASAPSVNKVEIADSQDKPKAPAAKPLVNIATGDAGSVPAAKALPHPLTDADLQTDADTNKPWAKSRPDTPKTAARSMETEPETQLSAMNSSTITAGVTKAASLVTGTTDRKPCRDISHASDGSTAASDSKPSTVSAGKRRPGRPKKDEIAKPKTPKVTELRAPKVAKSKAKKVDEPDIDEVIMVTRDHIIAASCMTGRCRPPVSDSTESPEKADCQQKEPSPTVVAAVPTARAGSSSAELEQKGQPNFIAANGKSFKLEVFEELGIDQSTYEWALRHTAKQMARDTRDTRDTDEPSGCPMEFYGVTEPDAVDRFAAIVRQANADARRSKRSSPSAVVYPCDSKESSTAEPVRGQTQSASEKDDVTGEFGELFGAHVPVNGTDSWIRRRSSEFSDLYQKLSAIPGKQKRTLSTIEPAPISLKRKTPDSSGNDEVSNDNQDCVRATKLQRTDAGAVAANGQAISRGTKPNRRNFHNISHPGQDLGLTRKGLPRRKLWTSKSDCIKRFRAQIEALGGEVRGPYVCQTEGIHCICPMKHDTWPMPLNIARGSGMCARCVGQDPAASEERFREIVAKFGGQVTGEYRNVDTKVEVKCQNGHYTTPLPSNVMRKERRGLCWRCSPKNPEQCEANFRMAVDDAGGEVVGEFVNSTTRVECLCANNHECHPHPSRFLAGQASLCQVCTGWGTEQAAERFKERVEEMGGEVRGTYEHSTTRVECKCPKGHTCYPLPCVIAQGYGLCSTCRTTKGEQRIMDIIRQEFNEAPVVQPSLGGHQRRADLKFRNWFIEFDGAQHFEEVHFFHHRGGSHSFEHRQKVDTEKTRLLLESGGKLIRIHYAWLNLSQAKQRAILLDALNSTHRFVVNDIEPYSWLKQFNPQLPNPPKPCAV